MNARHATVEHTAPRCGRRAAGSRVAAPVGAFALGGGLPDGGFGLVVVDAGNPRPRSRRSASRALVIAH